MAEHEEYLEANRRAEERRLTTPHAVSARYDSEANLIVIRLSSGSDLSFAPQDAQELEHARPEQLKQIEIGGSGFHIYWPDLDGGIYLPAALEGVFGSKKWMAARLGQSGDGRDAGALQLGGIAGPGEPGEGDCVREGGGRISLYRPAAMSGGTRRKIIYGHANSSVKL